MITITCIWYLVCITLSKFRYVKSRNDGQLRDAAKANQTSACEPEKTTADGKPIVPCGLIAWSLFNDTYSFTRGNENLTVDKKDISWKSDREHKFGKNVYPSNFQNGLLKGGGTLDPAIPVCELLIFAITLLHMHVVGGKLLRILLHMLNILIFC